MHLKIRILKSNERAEIKFQIFAELFYKKTEAKVLLFYLDFKDFILQYRPRFHLL